MSPVRLVPPVIGWLAVTAGGACRKVETQQAGALQAGQSSAAAAVPPASAAPTAADQPYRVVSKEEIDIAREAGFPTNFRECQLIPGTQSAVWSCAYARRSKISHDWKLRPCAPLLGYAPDWPYDPAECNLIFWDHSVKLPVDFADCKKRFMHEPGIVEPKDEEICRVYVSVIEGPLFETCRRMPFAEIRDGFCRYALAGPSWTPRPRSSREDPTHGP